MTPIPVLVTEDGLHARAVNAYPDFTSRKERLTVKTYDLTHYCTPGSVVHAELVWQSKWNSEKWSICHNCLVESFKEMNTPVRQAYQPLPITDADKIVSDKSPTLEEMIAHTISRMPSLDGLEEETVEEAAEKYAFQVPYDGTNNFYNKDKLQGFLACANWQKQQSINQYNKAINDAIELINLRRFELNCNSSNYHPSRLEEISALIDQLKQLIK